MIASERKRYIMQQLGQKGIISLKEIAKEIGTSEITIRRDFEKLEKEGRLKRVQGGAALDDKCGSFWDETGFSVRGRMVMHKEAKETAARAAAEFVKDGSSVFLDSGTSMIPFIKILEKRKIKIVTYNELLIRHITEPLAEIFMIGGRYHPGQCMNVGPSAQAILKDFYFDQAFISCSGVDFKQETAYTADMESLLMKKIAIENSVKRYLMIDHSKVDKKNFLKLIETSVFDQVVCNLTEKEYDFQLPSNVMFV